LASPAENGTMKSKIIVVPWIVKRCAWVSRAGRFPEGRAPF
jgi:hypothetical protein